MKTILFNVEQCKSLIWRHRCLLVQASGDPILVTLGGDLVRGIVPIWLDPRRACNVPPSCLLLEAEPPMPEFPWYCRSANNWIIEVAGREPKNIIEHCTDGRTYQYTVADASTVWTRIITGEWALIAPDVARKEIAEWEQAGKAKEQPAKSKSRSVRDLWPDAVWLIKDWIERLDWEVPVGYEPPFEYGKWKFGDTILDRHNCAWEAEYSSDNRQAVILRRAQPAQVMTADELWQKHKLTVVLNRNYKWVIVHNKLAGKKFAAGDRWCDSAISIDVWTFDTELEARTKATRLAQSGLLCQKDK